MPAKLYRTQNFAMPTTSAPVGVATGIATLKTLLQIATPANEQMRVVEWGISFDGSAAAAPGTVELIETDVAATVVAHVDAGITRLNCPNDVGPLMTLSTAGTGYTASAEGTTTTSRTLDVQQIAPTGQYIIQYPLGREPEMRASKFLRIRTKFAASVNAICYIVWEE